MSIRSVYFVLCCIVFLVSTSFAWSVSGTVSSNKGEQLEGVTVSVPSSPSIAPVKTNFNGAFTLKYDDPISIKSTNSAENNWRVHFNKNILEIESINSGPFHLSLMDALGKVLWEDHFSGVNGTFRLDLSKYAPSNASYLRIKKAKQESTYLLSKSNATVKTAALLPTITFIKTGYQDATYTLLKEIEENVLVVMRSTVSEPPACPATVLAPGDYNKAITISGKKREYILHVPKSYLGDAPVPLLVDFHPIGGSASGESGSSPYKNVTDKEGVITVYPNGLAGPMGNAWDVGPCCSDANDTGFVRALVTEVKTLTCIDSKRVYATGFSMGGGMSHYSACHLADVFAAVAPAAFDLLKENEASCSPSRPIPVISFRSKGDYIVAYDGGLSSVVSGMPIHFLGAKGTFKKWAELNKCKGSPSEEDSNGCSTYSDCNAGVKVTLCTKQGGGHDYGNASVGWPWLKQFTLP